MLVVVNTLQEGKESVCLQSTLVTFQAVTALFKDQD